MQQINTKKTLVKTTKNFFNIIPFILATLLITSLIVLIPKEFYLRIFSGKIADTFIGAILGSISAGNPITSYIVGGELLKQGISLIAITAFIISWVTVGIIQFPTESAILGKKFAIVRNITSFILAIIIAIITGIIYNVI